MYISKLSKLIEGNNLIINGFEKNDVNDINKGYAIRELARGELSEEIDRFSNLVRDSCPEIRDSLPLYLQTKSNPNSPYIGFYYRLSSEKITINKIIKNTPAEKADLLIDDIILGIKNGPAFPNINALRNFLEQQKAGNTIELIILRDGEEITKKVKLAAQP